MRYIGANLYATTHLWSACMFDDAKGVISAIELERIDRYKNSPNLGSFSLIPRVIDTHRTVLDEYLNPDEDAIHSLNYYPENQLLKHHYLHACSVYFSQASKDAAILCMDKNGYDSEYGVQFQTLWQGK
jgi:predicted NodU family carbamoyl transferase